MRALPAFLVSLVLAPAIAQIPPEKREFRLLDLVRAADGKIGMFAVNLRTRRQVAHNAGRSYHLGPTRALPVAAAALARLRATGRTPSHELSYPASAFRGYGLVNSSRGRSHGLNHPWTVAEAAEAALRFDDPTALDLLLAFISPEEVRKWLTEKQRLFGFGPITSVATEDARLLTSVDARFKKLGPADLARWYREGDMATVVPALFKAPPRADHGFRQALTSARRQVPPGKRNSVQPRDLAELLLRIYQASAMHPDDARLLWRILMGTGPLRFTHSAPIAWRAGGKDDGGPGYDFTCGVVETGVGPVVVSIHADGYGWADMTRGFLRDISRVAIKQTAPKAEAPPDGKTSQLRGLKHVALMSSSSASDLRVKYTKSPDDMGSAFAAAEVDHFPCNGHPSLAVVLGSEAEQTMVVRWFLPLGEHRTERRPIPPGTTIMAVFGMGEERRLPTPEPHVIDGRLVTNHPHDLSASWKSGPLGNLDNGEYRVRAAVDGKVVFDTKFYVVKRK